MIVIKQIDQVELQEQHAERKDGKADGNPPVEASRPRKRAPKHVSGVSFPNQDWPRRCRGPQDRGRRGVVGSSASVETRH